MRPLRPRRGREGLDKAVEAECGCGGRDKAACGRGGRDKVLEATQGHGG
jgi:hypothetical protein